MIKVKTIHEEFELKPTIFPDGTSQCWKLPEAALSRAEYYITWNFEHEREIIDLYSFKLLLDYTNDYAKTLRVGPFITLHIPYLPYARQDKVPSNISTFNLDTFAVLVNNLGFCKVTSVDVHNPQKTEAAIRNFENINVLGLHEKVIMDFAPSYICFPDKGALERYGKNLSHVRTLYCDKVRDQSTGQITDIAVSFNEDMSFDPMDASKILIIDDICDGGATFIGVSEALRKVCLPGLKVGLFVTHGIFSKGTDHLRNNGIDYIATTNSLLKNDWGYKV